MYRFPYIKRSCLVLFLVLAFVSIPLPSYATPPRPPVSLDVTLEEMTGRLVHGGFLYPIELVRYGSVQTVKVEAYFTPYRPARFSVKKNSVFRKEINARYEKQLNMTIPIDVKEPGMYELEVRVFGHEDKDNGFSDDILRYVLINKKSEYRIISPKQFVREEKEKRPLPAMESEREGR